ncbi:MAG: Fic family protein [Bacilli bacterium]|nr:Fic family protein [Bacilli bacterium]
MKDFYFDFKNGVLKNKLNITDKDKLIQAEDYFFYAGLDHLQRSAYFSDDPEYMHYLNYILFNKVYTWAGDYRLIDIERSEDALGGFMYTYPSFKGIEKSVDNVFLGIQRVKLNELSPTEKLNYIVDVLVKLWHTHPFRECNTRTMLAFINQYCSSASLSLDVKLLMDNFAYFRRSLMASVFNDEELGKAPNRTYTLDIMKNALKDNH